MKRFQLFIMIFGLAVACSFGRQATVPQDIVGVKVLEPTIVPRPGSSFSLFLEITVKPGFHVNSDHPGDEYLFPAKIEVTTIQGLELVKAVYPQGRQTTFSFSEVPISILEDVFKVELKFRAAPDLPCEELLIKGIFRFQACNEDACLQPKAVPFEKKIAVGPRPIIK